MCSLLVCKTILSVSHLKHHHHHHIFLCQYRNPSSPHLLPPKFSPPLLLMVDSSPALTFATSLPPPLQILFFRKPHVLCFVGVSFLRTNWFIFIDKTKKLQAKTYQDYTFIIEKGQESGKHCEPVKQRSYHLDKEYGII